MGTRLGMAALSMLWMAASSPGRSPRFVNLPSGIHLIVTFGSEEKKYILEYTGTGAGLTDYDGDGDLDLYLVNGQPLERTPGESPPRNRLYRNERGSFTDVTEEAGVGDTGWGAAGLFGDIDNDGDADLLITNYGPNVLYRNNGDGTFTDVTERAGVGDASWGMGAAFGDLDGDGFLDLYVANHAVFHVEKPPPFPCFWKGVPIACGPLAHEPETHLLYRNRGDGTFQDVSESSGIAAKRGYGFGVVMDYFDDDDRLDIYVANDLVENFLFLNRGDFRFEDAGALSGAAYVEGGREQAGMGVDSGDYDGDGRVDLYVTNFSDDYNTLYHNEGGGLFLDRTFEAGLGAATFPYLGWATRFLDADNDSDLDLFIVNGHVWPQADQFDSGTWYAQANQYFENRGDGTFVERSAEAGLGERRHGRGAAFGDVDDDGDLDVVVANMHSRPALLINEGGNEASWIQFLLMGSRSNREGIGARVTLEAGGKGQRQTAKAGGGYLSSHDLRLHFGLGRASRVESVAIEWPSGARDTFSDLPANRVYLVREGGGILAAR